MIIYLCGLASEGVNEVKRDEQERQSETDVCQDWHSHKGLLDEFEGQQHVLVRCLFVIVVDDVFRLVLHGDGVGLREVFGAGHVRARVDQSGGRCGCWGRGLREGGHTEGAEHEAKAHEERVAVVVPGASVDQNVVQVERFCFAEEVLLFVCLAFG